MNETGKKHQRNAHVEILLATKQVLLRDGLHLMLKRQPGFNVVGEAGNLPTTLKLAGELRPRVVLLDLGAQIPFALDALRGLTSSRGIRSIVLAEDRKPAQIKKTFMMGAAGIVAKELSARVLIRCIREVARGKYWIDDRAFDTPEAAIQGIAEPGRNFPDPDAFGLTPIDLSIISEIARGRSLREIEVALSIKGNALKCDLAGIYKKTGVSNRVELVLFAVHQGLAGNKKCAPPRN